MTKEEILRQLQKENPHSIPTFKAMDAWAKQQAVEFAEWGSDNVAYRSDANNEWVLNDGSPETFTTEQLYDLFKNQHP